MQVGEGTRSATNACADQNGYLRMWANRFVCKSYSMRRVFVENCVGDLAEKRYNKSRMRWDERELKALSKNNNKIRFFLN
jgi:hypothetical protein